MLQPFGTDLWIADGDTVSVAGFAYPTRMAVIRLSDSSLFLWSPIAISAALRDAVGMLGPVGHIVAPNHLHHLSLGDWAQAFPHVRCHAPPGLRRKRKDLAFQADLTDRPDPDWAGDIAQVIVRGNLITQEVVFFHRTSGTVLFADLVQQFPPDWHKGWRAAVARLDLMTAAEPSVPRKFRVAFHDRTAARRAISQVLDWPAERIIMAHGTPITDDARGYLRRAFAWLVGPEQPPSG